MDHALVANPHSRAQAADAVAAIVDQFEANIANGVWPSGHRLPTERELEKQFGIARNTLRKGLKILEGSGRIVRHVGRGSFVAGTRHPKPSNPINRIVGSSPAEVMEVRLVLEPWAVSLAATRATATDLAEMGNCLEYADQARDVPEFEEWDGKLHERIIASAKNELLAGLYEAINLARHRPEWIKLKERTVTPERRKTYQNEHRAIVEALSERDADRAAELARAHLLSVRMSLVGY